MKPQIETLDINSLIPYARNARTHSEAQIAQIAGSIKEFGFTNPILIDKDNGIIAGHGRVAAARKLNLSQVPCIRLEHLSETQRKAYILADNRIALNSGWEADLLSVEMAELKDLGINLESLGFDSDEIDALLNKIEPTAGLTDEDEAPEVQEQAVTKPGDIWVMGNHRLMCGDSTIIDAVDKLMAGQKADLIHTDPPYGIGYGGSMKLGQEKFGWKQHSGGWDEERPPKEFFDLAEAQCKNRIIWGGNYFADFLPPSMGWLVWDKGQRGFSLADGEMAWTSFNNAMRIKEFARAKANKEEKHHATQKPVEIVKWALEYADRHCKEKPKLVLDFFGGSGSTLIACEKTGRVSCLMELDPKYCDVIVKRWQQFTGKKAILEQTGQTYEELTQPSGLQNE